MIFERRIPRKIWVSQWGRNQRGKPQMRYSADRLLSGKTRHLPRLAPNKAHWFTVALDGTVEKEKSNF